MIIKIEGSKTFVFSDRLEPCDRLIEVNKMLAEELEFYSGKTTVNDYFHETFNIDKTRTNLEKISFYLSKMPEQNNTPDKELLSSNDHMEMTKGIRWKTVKGKRTLIDGRYKNFGDLKKDEKIQAGLVEPSEFGEQD